MKAIFEPVKLFHESQLLKVLSVKVFGLLNFIVMDGRNRNLHVTDVLFSFWLQL